MKIKNIKEKMKRQGLDSLVVTDRINIYYLTGFSGTAATVLLTEDADYFMTDDRYIDMATSIVEDMTLISTRDAFGEISKITGNLNNLGFEDSLDFGSYLSLSKTSKAELIPSSQFFMDFRQIKTDNEISLIRTACQITDHAFEAVLEFIQPGKTEIEAANFLDFKMRELGASGLSFDTIIASGKRSSLPHGVASRKVIEKGDVITLDFGCFYEHYASDMTRTIFVGEPDSKMREIYDTVRKANQALIDCAKVGLSYADFDKIPRDIIEVAGYGKNFSHGIGHGFGLEIHELPYFNQKMTDNYLQTNMIVTDEPGIYISDFAGVRIEDDLLILENGCEVLTKSPKELIVI
ncbi:MAG: Xaa-Pro peptidase family protein [Streptococcaceae bacterium]|jgi:Xaa-Pro aminopeptidase|nr:Xaa-Pro peptidase family protein [Streptococcaceae bacterium]